MVSGARAWLANADQCGPQGVQRGGVPVGESNKPIERPPLTGAAHRHRSPHHDQPGPTVPSSRRILMIRTVEAVVDPSGNVRLLEDVQLPGPRRALVTILDDAPRSEETALLSEGALADWSRPEEDAAWSHLQPAG